MINRVQRVVITLSLQLIAACGEKVQPTTPSFTSTETHVVTATYPPVRLPTVTESPFKPEGLPTVSDCWTPATSQISPDGQWTALPCEYGESSHLEIVNKEKTVVWDVSFQEITGISPCLEFINKFGEKSCFDGILYIHHWDKDSRYVFVDVNYLVDRAFNYSYGLYRLDVNTHEIMPWLKATQGFTYVYAFSSDNTLLVYQSSEDADSIHIHSLETEQISSYSIPNPSTGIAYLIWSPDNQKVAFSILHEGWFDFTGGFSLAVLDLETEQIKILIPDDKRQLFPTDWTSKTKIRLGNRTIVSNYQYDLQTNQLESIP